LRSERGTWFEMRLVIGPNEPNSIAVASQMHPAPACLVAKSKARFLCRALSKDGGDSNRSWSGQVNHFAIQISGGASA
jgi:hypothetical protein